MSLELAVRGIQPRAEQSQAERREARERSEALLRESQQPPKAAGAEGAPELREVSIGLQKKLRNHKDPYFFWSFLLF